jgi:hypothetical protein
LKNLATQLGFPSLAAALLLRERVYSVVVHQVSDLVDSTKLFQRDFYDVSIAKSMSLMARDSIGT